MPESTTASDERAIRRQAFFQIVQQSPNRTDVENAKPLPLLAQHSRKDRENSCFGFSSGGRCNQETTSAVKNRINRVFLKWAQLAPAQTIDDMVLNARVKTVESHYSFNSMSSTDAAALSSRLSSAPARVRLRCLRGSKSGNCSMRSRTSPTSFFK